jgi:hypothetical protein
VGDTFSFRIGLYDSALPEPVFTDEFCLVIEEEAPPEEAMQIPKRSGNRNKSGEGKKGEGKGDQPPTHGLPKCVLLTKDGRDIDGYSVEQWPEDFDELEGGLIEELGRDDVVYKINYDNSYHLDYRRKQRGQVAMDVVTEKYILGMRILMLGFEHALRRSHNQNGNEPQGVADFADEFRRMAARGAASTVLALAENLPKIVDASSISREDE